MEFILFNMTFTCIVDITFDLFVIDSSDELNMEAIIAFINLVLILGLAFAYFFLSEWITSDLLEIGDLFYNSPWYRLPSRKQSLLTLPIQRAQRVMRFKGLGLFNCSLAVFASVGHGDIDHVRVDRVHTSNRMTRSITRFEAKAVTRRRLLLLLCD